MSLVREHGVSHGADVFYRVKRMRVDFMNVAKDVVEVFSSDDREDDLNWAIDSFSIMGCDPVVCITEYFDKLRGVMLADDAYHNHADGEFFLDKHADKCSCGKPACVRQGGNHVVEVLHDLAYSEKPDVDLDEADQGCNVFEAMGDENDP